MKYLIDGEEYSLSTFESELNNDIHTEFVMEFEDELNTDWGSFIIKELTLDASYILKEMDEIAYDTYFNDFCDGKQRDIQSDLDRGNKITVNKFEYEIVEV